MGRLIISEEEKLDILRLYKLNEQFQNKKWASETEKWADFTVDVASGFLDSIPGIGNLASLGVDLTHTASYFLRGYYSKDESYKSEMYWKGIVSGILSFVPVVGNVLKVGFVKTFDDLLSAPDNVKKILNSIGINTKGSGQNISVLEVFLASLANILSNYSITNIFLKIKEYLKMTKNNIEKVINYITDYWLTLHPIIYLYRQSLYNVKEFIDFNLKLLESFEEVDNTCSSPSSVDDLQVVIIVNSFQDNENLEKQKNDLKNKGYKIYTQCLDNGLTRLGIIVKRSELETKFEEIKRDVSKKAWIMQFSDSPLGDFIIKKFKGFIKDIYGTLLN
jgi:hypothetical protein